MGMTINWIKHPGFYIKEELDERGWSQRDLAFILGVPEQAVNMIVSGKRGISPDMARALGDAFNVHSDLFANLQKNHDMALAKPPSPGVSLLGKMHVQYPVREMVNRGWLINSDANMLEEQLVRFFRVSDPSEIPYLEHAAKKRNSYEEREVPPAQLAWLFRVRQVAQSISVPQYSEAKLRDALEQLRGLLLAPEQTRDVPRLLSSFLSLWFAGWYTERCDYIGPRLHLERKSRRDFPQPEEGVVAQAKRLLRRCGARD